MLEEFAFWPGKCEPVINWDLADSTRIPTRKGKPFRPDYLRLQLFVEPISRITLYIEAVTPEVVRQPYMFVIESANKEPFTVQTFIKAINDLLNSKIPVTIWRGLSSDERHEVIRAWWRRTKTEAPMTWTTNNDAVIIDGYTKFPVMDLLGRNVLYLGLGRLKNTPEQSRWLLKTIAKP